jgi:hypothetical protein
MYRHGLERLLEIIDQVATYELYVVTCHMEIYEHVKKIAQTGRERVHAVYSPHSPFGISHTIRAGLEAAICCCIGKCVLYSKKRSAQDAHLADMKLVAMQHRSGAKESQATLCSDKWRYLSFYPERIEGQGVSICLVHISVRK